MEYLTWSISRDISVVCPNHQPHPTDVLLEHTQFGLLVPSFFPENYALLFVKFKFSFCLIYRKLP